MPLTILVVDDDLGTRLSISDYLELSGYSVVAAENGQKALELVNQYQPQLIVTDITMPRLDGYELIRQVRRQPEFRLLPVIFLTARTDVSERIRGYQVGCDAYLPKPFELPELGAVIRNLLDRLQLMESAWRSRSRPDTEEAAVAIVSAPPVTQELPRSSGHPSRTAVAIDLTPREQDVLEFLVQGLSNNQIGDHLHLSPRTIEKYVSSLLRKTDTNNRADLVRFAIEHRLIWS